MSIAQKIKHEALALGFDVVGITGLKPLEEGGRAIEQWVAEGRHGSMKYLEDFRKRRERLLSEIPDAKSVISLGVNYFSVLQTDKYGARSTEFKGRVARYAWGKDYHQVIAQKHADLIAQLKHAFPNQALFKSCVDTQPVPERLAAQQAGLGFIGKHTGLLNAQYGPWLFLSEIVTNLELTIDALSEGDCGTCTHCQKVCPTGALDQDYRIDARLCIAYLTIEHKGVIPRALRPQIKDWIFGCDECLAVCPFTSKQKETSWPEFRSEAGQGPWVLIEELFQLKSNREYEKKFSGSAMLRTGLKQMLRNACVVLGNTKSKSAVLFLKQALHHPSPMVRIHAAWGLGQVGDAECRQLLAEQQTRETDPEVQDEIRQTLEEVSSSGKSVF